MNALAFSIVIPPGQSTMPWPAESSSLCPHFFQPISRWATGRDQVLAPYWEQIASQPRVNRWTVECGSRRLGRPRATTTRGGRGVELEPEYVKMVSQRIRDDAPLWNAEWSPFMGENAR